MPESIVSLEKAKEVLENGMKTADEWLGSNEKMEQLFNDVSSRLKTTPLIGDTINDFPTMVSMVKDYVSKDYTKVSPKVIATVVSAFLYLISRKDIIPDNVPVLGILDDLAVIGLADWFTQSKKYPTQNSKEKYKDPITMIMR